MKTTRSLINTTLVSASVLGLVGIDLASSASAKTLVNCGRAGGVRIVDKVPVGCHVLTVNSPPKQAGNRLDKARRQICIPNGEKKP